MRIPAVLCALALPIVIGIGCSAAVAIAPLSVRSTFTVDSTSYHLTATGTGYTVTVRARLTNTGDATLWIDRSCNSLIRGTPEPWLTAQRTVPATPVVEAGDSCNSTDPLGTLAYYQVLPGTTYAWTRTLTFTGSSEAALAGTYSISTVAESDPSSYPPRNMVPAEGRTATFMVVVP